MTDAFHGQQYGEGYWMRGEGSNYVNFQYKAEINRPKAAAFVAASRLPQQPKILDYGCGMGPITAALLSFGYDAVGVDTGEWAIEHCVPEARGHVKLLQGTVSKMFTGERFDLVIAKDVFEHVPVEELPAIVGDLMSMADKLIFLVPVAEQRNGKFVAPQEEKDTSHVTRLTREQWLEIFPYKHTVCNDVVTVIRGVEASDAYICVLLEAK